MNKFKDRQQVYKNAKKPFWTKIVTVILVIIAVDLALLLADFVEVFIQAEEPRFAQVTASDNGDTLRHYTGLGYSFDIEGTPQGDEYIVNKANFNIFGQYLCTTK